MKNESLIRFDSEISYLEYKIATLDELITIYKSDKNTCVKKLKHALDVKTALLALLNKKITQKNRDFSLEIQQEEEELLRRNRRSY